MLGLSGGYRHAAAGKGGAQTTRLRCVDKPNIILAKPSVKYIALSSRISQLRLPPSAHLYSAQR